MPRWIDVPTLLRTGKTTGQMLTTAKDEAKNACNEVRNAEGATGGLADDSLSSAFEGVRSSGGHAIRHLRNERVIPSTGSLDSQVSAFKELISPILQSPSKTFDWTLGTIRTRAFAGVAAGKNVVGFVAKEGIYQGRVLSAVVPDVNQITQWGLP